MIRQRRFRFGVKLSANRQTSFTHPPFGFSLFYLRSVAPPTVKTTQIYWGAIPFVVIQLIMVGLVIVFPGLVTDNARKDTKQDAPVEFPTNLDQLPSIEPLPGSQSTTK